MQAPVEVGAYIDFEKCGTSAPTVILEDLAERFAPSTGMDEISTVAVEEMITKARRELETALDEILVPSLLRGVASVFQEDEAESLTAEEAMVAWFRTLPEETRHTRVAGDAMVLAAAAQHMVESPEANRDAVVDLAQQILGTEPNAWTDETVSRVCGRIEGAKRTVEITPGPIRSHERPERVPLGHMRLTIAGQGPPVDLNFVVVDEISETGKNLASIVRSTIDTMRQSLPAGECETILVKLLSDTFK